MHNSDQEKQDQRVNTGMEDSPATTIEFLRARLLSERSVSRSARQRADELAKKVAELEEQLKFVSLQRKKAEKATEHVLAILENNGITDVSEASDSSSEEESPYKSKVGNSSIEGEESTISSRVRRNGSEELSGSDHDISPVPGRSLSWKGRKNSPSSPEKYKNSLMRRPNSLASAGSSSPRCQGKSCRQIRHRESRSVVEDLKADPSEVDLQEKGVSTSATGVFPKNVEGGYNIFKGGSEEPEERALREHQHSSCLENGTNGSSNEVDFHGYGAEEDMERALEYQAELIERYEGMERAQREWEEKFKDNNSSTPDSCDPGNHSDVTEERDDIKAQAQYATGTVASQVKEATSNLGGAHFSKDLPNTQSKDFLPPLHSDMGRIQDKQFDPSASETAVQDFAFSVTDGKQNQECLENKHDLPSHSSPHHQMHLPVSHEIQSAVVFSSNSHNGSPEGETSQSQSELYALVPHQTSGGLNIVLEALKQAKLSLQHKMGVSSLAEDDSVGKTIEPVVPARKGKVPIVEAGTIGGDIEPSILATTVGARVEIPAGAGFAGLFRVPTDFLAEATETTALGSGSRLSLPNRYPDASVLSAADDRLFTRSYLDSRPSFSTDDRLVAGAQFNRFSINTRSGFSTSPTSHIPTAYTTNDRILTGRYTQTGSRISTEKPSFGLCTDSSLPSASQYTYPSISSYPDIRPPTHTREEFSTFPPGSSVGVPRNHSFSFDNDNFRPNMYR